MSALTRIPCSSSACRHAASTALNITVQRYSYSTSQRQLEFSKKIANGPSLADFASGSTTSPPEQKTGGAS
ncbi:hypothetical protein HDU76_011733, partial [Blyttiomyces sp. JEL0837]